MATIIELTESKAECMQECTEKVLHYAGKLMTYLESLDGTRYGEKDYREYRDYEHKYGRERKEFPRYY